MEIFINSSSAISPIDSFNGNPIDLAIPENELGWLKCIEPVYKEHINPGKLRRMARVVRMGVTTGTCALKDAGIDNPDAIIMGTGLGCVLDTEKFLQQIVENTETLLNPTAFIQSTHNTVSGQIALLLGCNSYNFTFTQKDISFESSLLEAIMMINDGEAENALVGAVDEITTDSYELLTEAGCLKTDANEQGYIPGEGSAFFVVSNKKSENNLAQFNDLTISYNIKSTDELLTFVSEFLTKNNLEVSAIDTLICGDNLSTSDRKWHAAIKNKLGAASNYLNSKDYSGEHDSSSSFALWLAVNQIQHMGAKNILIYNTNKGKSHSLMLLAKC